jgi:Ca-activated chloride channel family protein
MNRKTTSILVAAGGLVAAAALLGTRDSGSTTAPVPLPLPEKPQPALCGPAAPARASADFGAGSLTAALSGAKILRGGDGELFVAVDVVAREAEVTTRPPMSVAIVIDHSGSMQGEKMARARDAARGLVERLGERDRVALVQYDDTADLLVPATVTDEAGKRRLTAAIDSIQDAGGTNLHDGLMLGRDQILQTMTPGHVNRVILLSDGNANVGITNVATLARIAGAAAERGVRITTVGLGIDYNEDLMEAVAENGRGQYYYVKDAGSLDAVFAGELRAIQATVATAAELRLEPACAGVEIAEVFGYVTRREGHAVIVPLADVAGGDKRKVVARLRVPTGSPGAAGVLGARLSFATPAGAKKMVTAAVGVELTDDAAAVEAALDPAVLAKVEQADAAVVMRQAAEAYTRGDQAGALRAIDKKRDEAKRRALKYRMKDADLKPMYESLDSVGAGMAATPSAAPAAPSMTKAAKARAYELAK